MKFLASLIIITSLITTHSWAATKAAKQCKIMISEAVKTEQTAKDKEMPDRFEAQRDWGTKILSDHDPAWKDPEYLARLQEFAVPNITNYGGKAERLLYEHQDYMNKFFPGRVRNFTSNGTDANNMLFLYAKSMFERRTRTVADKLKILSFDGIYGGSYGPILHLKKGESSHIKGPFIIPGQKLSAKELRELEKYETEVLQKIESEIKDVTNQVGAIFMESIPAAHGVKMFRTEFVLKLRELADKYETPIFADEILTGGGRTGKFWAFQHYEGFTPDLVTFGKGLAVSGIFAPQRKNSPFGEPYIDYAPPPTTQINPLALLQSLQVVKNIWERRLDLNAAEAGAYMMQKTREAMAVRTQKTGKVFETDRLPLSGIGFLITGFPSYDLTVRSSESDGKLQAGYNFRVLPVLTTTKQDVDWVIKTHLKWDLDQQR